MIRSEMLERMSAREFTEWMMLEQIEPFGDRRGDVQAGTVAATIANVNRAKKTDKIFTPFDFMINWEPEPERQQTPQQQLDTMYLLQKLQNDLIAAHA